MNKYRVTLGILTITFVVVSVLSSAIGTGLIQLFLILLAIALFLGIFAIGINKFGLEDFWWKYFKPTAALPIAWGTLHLGFAMMFPDAFSQIWEMHRGLLLMINICAFVLNSIVSKKTDFEKRASRWLLATTYVLLFIISGIMIGHKLLNGESAADMDREISAAFAISKVELMSGEIEENNKKNKSKSYLIALNYLLEKSAKGNILSPDELRNVKRLKAKIKEIYPKNNEPKEKGGPIKKVPRVVSAIFKLPANGILVDRDEKGRKFRYKKGHYVYFEQLTSPGELVCVNEDSSWSRKKKNFRSYASASGSVKLMSCSGRDMTIRVTVKNG